jgi:hypothetical protein
MEGLSIVQNTRRSFMAKLIAALTVASIIQVQKDTPRKKIVMQPNTRIDVPAGYSGLISNVQRAS